MTTTSHAVLDDGNDTVIHFDIEDVRCAVDNRRDPSIFDVIVFVQQANDICILMVGVEDSFHNALKWGKEVIERQSWVNGDEPPDAQDRAATRH